MKFDNWKVAVVFVALIAAGIIVAQWAGPRVMKVTNGAGASSAE